MTISAGCYAISPSYNYVPETTCTNGPLASATSAAQSTTVQTTPPASMTPPPLTTSTPPPTPTSTTPPAPSRLLIIYSDLIAIEDGEGTTVDDWYAVDFTITGNPTPGSIDACSAEDGQELPNDNENGQGRPTCVLGFLFGHSDEFNELCVYGECNASCEQRDRDTELSGLAHASGLSAGRECHSGELFRGKYIQSAWSAGSEVWRNSGYSGSTGLLRVVTNGSI